MPLWSINWKMKVLAKDPLFSSYDNYWKTEKTIQVKNKLFAGNYKKKLFWENTSFFYTAFHIIQLYIHL